MSHYHADLVMGVTETHMGGLTDRHHQLSMRVRFLIFFVHNLKNDYYETQKSNSFTFLTFWVRPTSVLGKNLVQVKEKFYVE